MVVPGHTTWGRRPSHLNPASEVYIRNHLGELIWEFFLSGFQVRASHNSFIMSDSKTKDLPTPEVHEDSLNPSPTNVPDIAHGVNMDHYRATVPLWKRVWQHSLTQMMLLSVQAFCGPAMSDAITGEIFKTPPRVCLSLMQC